MLKNLPVICSEQNRGGGFAVGVIELCRPQSLNALNTECYEIIEKKLIRWSKQSNISAIIIYSNNTRAFCAGGDIKSLVIETRKVGLKTAENFFTEEYFVDYLIHIYKKPIIVLADGITMGAGIGLMNGASHRLVTENSSLAMPEQSIGLFPDVGATHFLNKLPKGFGLFMGLTGCRINGATAIEVGLADFFMPSRHKNKVIADIFSMPWTDSNSKNNNMLTNYFIDVFGQIKITSDLGNSLSQKDLSEISNIFDLSVSPDMSERIDYFEMQRRFLNLKTNSDFISENQKRFCNGSELSKQLFFKAYHDHRLMDLKDTFLAEWEMALKACQGNEFFEGVRALLIDKDNKPNWGYSANKPIENIETYFRSNRHNLLADKFTEFFRNI